MSLSSFFEEPEKQVQAANGAVILDCSNLIFRALYADAKNEEPSIEMFRHLALYQVLKYRKKFDKIKYPNLIAVFDGSNVWRRKTFPQYKMNRDPEQKLAKLSPREAEFERKKGEMTKESFVKIRNEFIEHLPYPTMVVDGAEADDIIAVLAKYFAKQEQPVVVVSTDEDFRQLTSSKYIRQWSPSLGKEGSFYTGTLEEIELAAFHKLCKGDGGDGVPNVLSPDETFYPAKMRQKSLHETKIHYWWENRHRLSEVMDATTFDRFKRNRTMIDLNEIPEAVVNLIQETWKSRSSKNVMMSSMKFVNYLMSKGLNHLLERSSQF